jgi:hypothetical protein
MNVKYFVLLALILKMGTASAECLIDIKPFIEKYSETNAWIGSSSITSDTINPLKQEGFKVAQTSQEKINANYGVVLQIRSSTKPIGRDNFGNNIYPSSFYINLYMHEVLASQNEISLPDGGISGYEIAAEIAKVLKKAGCNP